MTLQRTESFTPLTAAPETREPREFRAKIVPQAEATRPFQTLELRPAAPASGGKKICEPRVSVQRDGDRVTNIRVECTCGQVMDVACVYDEPEKPA